MEDLALRPEMADAVLGHIFDFYYEHHRRIFEAGRGRIDLTWVAEDLGSQTGPLMSLAMYRRFLLPNQIKMAELARSYGVHVMYHTDGAARAFLPDLIDCVGIEILNPIQWRCPGMERERLVADFGERIIFHGSIDNQQTLPFGTVDDVIREVRAERAYLRQRPLDLRSLPQSPTGQPDRKHRGHVRSHSRVGRHVGGRSMTNFSWSIDGSIVGLYLLATMIAGVMVRRYVGKVEDFLVAGREVNVFLGIASLAATEFGVITCMYTAEGGYSYGFAGATPGILMALAMFFVGATGFCVKPLREAG